MSYPDSYPSSPFFRPDTPPVSSPTFRDWVLSPAHKRFWISKERSWQRAGIVITRYEFLDWLVAQDGKCALCSLDQTVFGRMLAVDHSHNGGGIRGLLCYADNWKIGKVEQVVSCGGRLRFTVKQVNYLAGSPAGRELLELQSWHRSRI